MRFGRRSPLPLLAAAFSALLIVCLVLSGGPEGLLAALPAVLFVLALVLGRYPGEELIEWLARRLRPPRRRPVSATAPRRGEASLPSFALALLAGVRTLRGPPLLSSLPR
jgi:hypothetical protein